MSVHKKQFGNKSLKREIEIGITLLFFLGFIVFGIYLALVGFKLPFDIRNRAAGRTVYLESNGDLQKAINEAQNSDAIFLKVGEYSTKSPEGFVIKDKDIRILGAGNDFVNVSGSNVENIFKIENAGVEIQGIKIAGANKDAVSIKNNNQKIVSLRDVVITTNSGAAIKTDSGTTIKTSTLEKNASGIESTNGVLTVENTVIRDSAYTSIKILSSNTAKNTIKNTVISKSGEQGILLEGGQENVVKNVTLINNKDGLVEKNAAKTLITNSVVQNSSSQGIVLVNSQSSVSYTNSFGNKAGDFLPETLKTVEGNKSVDGNISTANFRLENNSPLKSQGLPAETNKDGSRVDIGAFGGNTVNLVSLNSEPKVQSVSPKYIKPGEKYTYEVKATDPDNDALTYTIVNKNAPTWVKQAGNKLEGVPTTSDIGFWGILLVVSDKNGHNVVHPITINVIPSERTSPTATAPTPIQTPEEQKKEVAKITFVTPKQDTVFTKGINEIKWEIFNGSNVESLTIKYSNDKENFVTLTTVQPNTTNYNWDSKDLTPGKYILRVEAKEKGADPLVVADVSQEFELKDVPQNLNGKVQITKNSPEDNDVIENKRESIVVEFKPEAELDREKTYLRVNGSNVEYQTTKNTIFYQPKADYGTKKVTVEAKIVSKAGSETSKIWTFNLPSATTPQEATVITNATSKVLGLPKPVGLGVLAILIILIFSLILYFFVKLLKTIREERQGSLEADFTDYYDNSYNAPEFKAEIPVTQQAAVDMNQYLAPAVANQEAQQIVNQTDTTTFQPQQVTDPLPSQTEIQQVTSGTTLVPAMEAAQQSSNQATTGQTNELEAKYLSQPQLVESPTMPAIDTTTPPTSVPVAYSGQPQTLVNQQVTPTVQNDFTSFQQPQGDLSQSGTNTAIVSTVDPNLTGQAQQTGFTPAISSTPAQSNTVSPQNQSSSQTDLSSPSTNSAASSTTAPIDPKVAELMQKYGLTPEDLKKSEKTSNNIPVV